MIRLVLTGAALALVTGCGSYTDRKEITLLDGYRDPADACRRVGETPYTNQFLDDSADLVACPTGGENIGVFVTETGARALEQVGIYTLYSVPRV